MQTEFTTPLRVKSGPSSLLWTCTTCRVGHERELSCPHGESSMALIMLTQGREGATWPFHTSRPSSQSHQSSLTQQHRADKKLQDLVHVNLDTRVGLKPWSRKNSVVFTRDCGRYQPCPTRKLQRWTVWREPRPRLVLLQVGGLLPPGRGGGRAEAFLLTS